MSVKADQRGSSRQQHALGCARVSQVQQLHKQGFCRGIVSLARRRERILLGNESQRPAGLRVGGHVCQHGAHEVFRGQHAHHPELSLGLAVYPMPPLCK